jgi:hypothetical protein
MNVAEKLQASRARIDARGPKEKSGGAPVARKHADVPICKRCGQHARLTDSAGNTWCVGHATRYRLAQWAYAHQYIEVKCPPYAIAAGYDLWIIALVLGSEDFMRVAYTTMQSEVA